MSNNLTDDEKKVTAAFLALATVAFEPMVMAQLWRWFVVPLGVVALTWAQAFGIIVLTNMCIKPWPGERDAEAQYQAAVYSVVSVIVAFSLGWIVFRLSA